MAEKSAKETPWLAEDQALVLPGKGDPEVDPKIAAAFGRAGDAYNKGNFATALETWRRLAGAGFGPALYNLGVMHEHGRGVAVDYTKAANWYRKAAKQEVPGALVNLARLHVEGRGVKRDPDEALHLLEQASQLGSAPAQFNLGAAYLQGLGTEADPEEAAVWFEMAAEQGHAPAAYNLAVLYQRGGAIESDLEEAERYFTIAADAGDAFAHLALGDLLAQSKTELAKAIAHLDVAARAGVAAAQNRLAIMLAKGEGAKRDRETALMWFHVAAGLGAANAARNRDALAASVSKHTRDKAKRRADTFRPQPPPVVESSEN